AGDVFAALVQTANLLEVSALVSGLSSKMTAADQAYHVGQAWEALPEPKRQFTFYVVRPNGDAQAFHIGPHAPALQGEDVQLVHRLWLNFRRDPGMEYLHHTDIVTFALTRLASEYARNKEETLKELRTYTKTSQHDDNILRHLPQGPSAPIDKYAIPAPKPQRESPDTLDE
ncbi:MAG TPA: APC family permease, partial [Acidobacteriaceae bacterium]|nr:APC family permease [Acidobacteriaceae bacterium]